MLIKPFTATVANGIAQVGVTHSLAGMTWVVYQIGFALGINQGTPQVAAQVNGTPLGATIVMQPSAFVSLPGFSPYAMLSYMVGPPYIFLQSGDKISTAVLGAQNGDVFTVSAYLDEMNSLTADKYTMAGTYIAGS